MMKKNLLRSIFVAAFAAFLVASIIPQSNAASRPGVFDGDWSVVIYTLKGDCDRSLRYSLRIVGGRVQAEDSSYQASGAVSAGGAISVRVAQGDRSAGGSGRLAGNSGRGSWRTDTGDCAGQWTAERRAANY
jgi:hypothetical protein